MNLVQYTTFLILLLNQSIARGFSILVPDGGCQYLNRERKSITSSLAPDKEIMTRWILQEIDHFNSKDKRKWHMKYFEGLKYWRENGPIYLFLGGAETASREWARSGIMNELAKETLGAMYITEHRYYGDSKPFIDLNAENIQYLSSRQALADIAKLIFDLKSLPMYKNSKVVVIGGSYAGNLAAWMKVLYPNLIDAAIASSSPVLAQKNFYEALEKVKDNYERYGGTECLNNIRKKFENYDSLLWSPEGINQLKIQERICDLNDMTVKENQLLFILYKIDPFVPNRYRNPQPFFIEFHCDNLDNVSDYKRFLIEHSKVNNYETHPCLYVDFNDTINELQDQRNYDDRYLWLYQICTEFGYFETTNSKDQPFLNIPLEFYIKICSELFGNNFNETRVDKGVENSNKLYGGLKPNVTKVIFTNGDMDQWSTLSVLKDLPHDAPAILIPGASQCEDLRPAQVGDSKELKEVRNYIKYSIRKWIGADKYLN